jgi:hypothetical protein
MKSLHSILFTILLTSSLSGCNTMQTVDIASACEQGIKSLNQHLSARPHNIHQTNLSRANSLLEAAQVQHQFAEYPGCVDKVKRAQDYLSGRKTAIISRLSI